VATKKILWVEDDPDLVKATLPILRSEGWEVRTAESAAQGKVLVAEARPDLVIMDIIMEGEHGFQAVEDLKNDPSLAGIPVVIYTSVTHRWRETTATRQDGMLTQAEAFVDKTDGPEALLHAIRKHLG